jgi:hypothetical protein
MAAKRARTGYLDALIVTTDQTIHAGFVKARVLLCS